MYSPDQADIDPRNPANQPDAQAEKFYIDPNQFSDADSEMLECFPEVSTNDESQAREDAFRMARHIMKPITISCFTEEGWELDSIIIKPTLKLA